MGASRAATKGRCEGFEIRGFVDALLIQQDRHSEVFCFLKHKLVSNILKRSNSNKIEQFRQGRPKQRTKSFEKVNFLIYKTVDFFKDDLFLLERLQD